MENPNSGYVSSKFSKMSESLPKVLIVLESCGGGSGRHVTELAAGLLQSGCDVHVIYSQLRAERIFHDAVAKLRGLRVQQLPMHREPHWSDLGFLWQIRSYMNRIGGFDVVHAHSSKAGALARVAALATNAAKIYTPHAMRTMDSTLHPAVRTVYRAIEVGLARTSCDAVIAVSEYERNHIVAAGVPASKVYVVTNGIPPLPKVDRSAIRAELGIAPDEVAIGFIGRLVPQKAPERFVCALANVARRVTNVRGVLIGTGPLQAETHALARAIGVFERIVWVTDRPGPALLPAFDVLMMPSLYEAMPYVLLEALAGGVPVIATHVGGVAEAIEDEVTGFIVPQHDSVALVDKVQLLVENTGLRQTMARASLRKSNEMTAERMVDQTLQVYRAVLRTRSARDSRLPAGLDARRAG